MSNESTASIRGKEVSEHHERTNDVGYTNRQWFCEIVTIDEEDHNDQSDLSSEIVAEVASSNSLEPANHERLKGIAAAENVIIKREDQSNFLDWSNDITTDVASNNRVELTDYERSSEILAANVVIKREDLSDYSDFTNEMTANVAIGNRIESTNQESSNEIITELEIATIKKEYYVNPHDLTNEITSEVATDNVLTNRHPSREIAIENGMCMRKSLHSQNRSIKSTPESVISNRKDTCSLDHPYENRTHKGINYSKLKEMLKLKLKVPKRINSTSHHVSDEITEKNVKSMGNSLHSHNMTDKNSIKSVVSNTEKTCLDRPNENRTIQATSYSTLKKLQNCNFKFPKKIETTSYHLSNDITEKNVTSMGDCLHSQHKSDKCATESAVSSRKEPHDLDLTNEFRSHQGISDSTLKRLVDLKLRRKIISQQGSGIVENHQYYDMSRKITSLCQRMEKSGEECAVMYINKDGYGYGIGTQKGSEFLHEHFDILSSFHSYCNGQSLNVQAGTSMDAVNTSSRGLSQTRVTEVDPEEEMASTSYKHTERENVQAGTSMDAVNTSSRGLSQTRMTKVDPEEEMASTSYKHTERENANDYNDDDDEDENDENDDEDNGDDDEEGSENGVEDDVTMETTWDSDGEKEHTKETEKRGVKRRGQEEIWQGKIPNFIELSAHAHHQLQMLFLTKPFGTRHGVNHWSITKRRRYTKQQNLQELKKRASEILLSEDSNDVLKDVMDMEGQSEEVQRTASQHAAQTQMLNKDKTDGAKFIPSRVRLLIAENAQHMGRTSVEESAESKSTSQPGKYYIPRKPSGPLVMADILKTFCSQEDNSCLLNNLKGLQSRNTSDSDSVVNNSLEGYMAEFNQIHLRKNKVKMITQINGIVSLDVHPLNDALLSAYGGFAGGLALWKSSFEADNDQEQIVAYTPHSQEISCVKFSPFNWSQILTTSFDGTMRLCDIEKGVFDEICSTPEADNVKLLHLDFLSEHTILISQNQKMVYLIDKRTPGTKPEQQYLLHKQSVSTVSVNPVNRNHFVTASWDGSVRLWDLRLLHPENQVHESLDSVMCSRHYVGAFFSPVSGKYLLSTVHRHKCWIKGAGIKSVTVSEYVNGKLQEFSRVCRHNNNSKMYLRAEWHPSREDMFIMGSLSFPKVTVFGADCSVLKEVQDEKLLTSVCYRNAVHPTRNSLLCADISGRVHVFQ